MGSARPSPAAPLKIPCTMYLKKDKFAPKKSKIYLRYRQRASSSDELTLGVAELDIAEHLNPKRLEVPLQETITLSFQKCIDKSATVTFQFRARWMQDVDVAQLREENPDAVSRMSGVSTFAREHGSQLRHEDDEPHDDDDADEADARRRRRAADEKMLEKSKIRSPPVTTAASPDEEEEYVEDEEEEEDEEERAARKAAKKARKEAKRAKKAAKRSQEEEEEATDSEEEHTETAPAPVAPIAAAPAVQKGANGAHAIAPSPAIAAPAAAATAAVGAVRSGSIKGASGSPAQAQLQPQSHLPPIESAAPAPPLDDSDDPNWTNFTGTIPYILSLQSDDQPELEVPLPLYKLLKALKKLNGFECDAIFKRGPSDPSLVEALKGRIESNVYKLKTDDPRVPAACVKLWFASIAIPIFTPNVHEIMLQAGAMEDGNDKKQQHQRAEDDDDDDDDDDGPNADPRYRKANHADAYGDLLAASSASRAAASSSSSGPRLVDLIERVVQGIPESHRLILQVLIQTLRDGVLERRARRSNGMDEASLATIFGDLLTRLRQKPGQGPYEFFQARQAINRFFQHLLTNKEYYEILENEYPDVPYPNWRAVQQALLPPPPPQPTPAQRTATTTSVEDYSDIIGASKSHAANANAAASVTAVAMVPPVAPIAPATTAADREPATDDEADADADADAIAAGTVVGAAIAKDSTPDDDAEEEEQPHPDEEEVEEEEPVDDGGLAATATATAVVAATGADEYEEEDDDAAEERMRQERKEAKRAKKEAKRLKKEAKRRRQQYGSDESDDVEEEEHDNADASATETPHEEPIAEAAEEEEEPTHQDEHQPEAEADVDDAAPHAQSDSPLHTASAPVDPFADLISIRDPPIDSAAAAAVTAAPHSSFESFAVVSDDDHDGDSHHESDADRVARMIREAKEAKRARKLAREEEERRAQEAAEAEAQHHEEQHEQSYGGQYDDLMPQPTKSSPTPIANDPFAALLGAPPASDSRSHTADHTPNSSSPRNAASSSPRHVAASSTQRTAELEERIHQLESELYERDQTIRQHEDHLNQKADEISKHIDTIHEKDQIIDEKDAIILEKDHTIADQAHAITDKEHALAEKDALIDDKEHELARLTSQLVDSGKVHEDRVIELEEQISVWRSEAKAATKAARAAEAQLASQAASSPAAAASTPPSLPSPSKDYESRIQKLKTKLHSAHAENDELFEQVESLKKEVETMQQSLEEKSQSISKLEQKLAASLVAASVLPTSTRSSMRGSSAGSSSVVGVNGLTVRPISDMTPDELSQLGDAIRQQLGDATPTDPLDTPLSLRSSRSVSGRGDRKLSSSLTSVTDMLEKKDLEIRRLQTELHAAQEAAQTVTHEDSTRMEELETELNEMKERHKEQVEQLETKLEEERKTHELDSSRLRDLDSHLVTLERDLNESHRRLVASDASRTIAQRDTEKLEGKVLKLESQLLYEFSNLQNMLKQREEELEDQNLKLEELKHEKERLATQLANKKAKVKEILATYEKKLAANNSSVGSSSKRRVDDDSSDDDSTAARRKRRAAAAAAASSSSPSSAAIQDLAMYKQLLSDKNALLAEHESTESVLQDKIGQLEADLEDSTQQLKMIRSENESEIRVLQEKNIELSGTIKRLQRDLNDFQQQTQALLVMAPEQQRKSNDDDGEVDDQSSSHIASLERSIQSYVAQVRTLEEHQAELSEKILQLESTQASSSSSSRKSGASPRHAAKLEVLLRQNAELQARLDEAQQNAAHAAEKEEAESPAGSSSSASAAASAAEVASLHSDLTTLKSQFDSTLELHKLRLRELESDSNAKITILQKFKHALSDKFQQLEAENEQLRARMIMFQSLNDAIDKKYLEPSTSKKKSSSSSTAATAALDRKELTLLQAFQEQQRRTAFLETQLQHSDDTLKLTKETYNQTNLVLEQELEGLEHENENLRELYQELKTQLQQALIRLSPRANDDTNAAKYLIGSITVDWARYENVKTRLSHYEQANGDLELDLNRLRLELQLKSDEIHALNKKLEHVMAESETIREELVRTGITLKTIVGENQEMKEYINGKKK